MKRKKVLVLDNSFCFLLMVLLSNVFFVQSMAPRIVLPNQVEESVDEDSVPLNDLALRVSRLESSLEQVVERSSVESSAEVMEYLVGCHQVLMNLQQAIKNDNYSKGKRRLDVVEEDPIREVAALAVTLERSLDKLNACIACQKRNSSDIKNLATSIDGLSLRVDFLSSAVPANRIYRRPWWRCLLPCCGGSGEYGY